MFANQKHSAAVKNEQNNCVVGVEGEAHTQILQIRPQCNKFHEIQMSLGNILQ